MRIHSILVPIDLSDCSLDALEIAETLARQNQAEVLLLCVEEAIIPYDEKEETLLDPLSLEDHGRLAHIRPRDRHIEFQRFVKFGHPSEAILEFAKEHEIDLIVMGTHGRTGINRVLPGSVASAIMQAAPCPVLAMRSGCGGQRSAQSPAARRDDMTQLRRQT
jgi:nucleotide-binding universal stress UspA family protein